MQKAKPQPSSMKNPKPGKGFPHKGPSSSSSPAVGSGNRAPRLEPDDKPPSDRQPFVSDSRPPKPAASPSLIPKDPPGPAQAPPPGPLRPYPPAGFPFPLPDPAAAAAPPPPYGFDNLERRTIVLADGSVRSYFALPPDPPPESVSDRMFPYGPGSRPGFGHGPEPGRGLGFEKHYPPPPGARFSPDNFREPPFGRGPVPQHDYWASLGLDGPRGLPEGGMSLLKRKYGEEEEFARHRQHVAQYGNSSANPNGFPLGPAGEREPYLGKGGNYDDIRSSKQPRLGGDEYKDLPSRTARPDSGDVPPFTLDVDRQALTRAFLRFSKTINENSTQKKNYLENGKNERLNCVVCGRASKDFADVHGLVMHAYTSPNADLRVDHLGLHKALCVLMGWNYAKAPENSKGYQMLSANEAQANRDDLILWPPTIIIHNTNTGKKKDGRMEGLGNKDMDIKLKEQGFVGGKAKSLYGKEGHTGVTVVKFANTEAGLKEAERLVEFFEKDDHGRKGWARAQASQSSDDDKNPMLVKKDEKTGEKKRIHYGYLATASDLDKLDFDLKKRASVKSRTEFDLSD